MDLPKLKQFRNFEEVKNNQKERLQKLLYHVWNKSKFYRIFYEDHGLKKEYIPQLTVRDLPVVEKNIIMDNWDDVVTLDNPKLKKSFLLEYIADRNDLDNLFLDDKFYVIHSSGTTGEPALFTYGKDEFMFAMSHLVGRFPNIPTPQGGEKTKIAFVGAADGRYAGVSMSKFMRVLGANVLIVNVNDPLALSVNKLSKIQPHWISGYPSTISLLADQQIEGNLKISPVLAICGGEVLTPQYRERIRMAWNLEANDVYACSETVGMSSTCAQGSLHLFDDLNIFEILDEKLNVIKRGNEGRLYLTNLYLFLVPLIRYKTGDQLTLSEEDCECGTPFSVVQKIGGRAEEFCWFKTRMGKDQYIHPIVMAEFFVNGLRKIQFVQKPGNSFTLRVVIDDQETIPRIKSRMCDILTQCDLIHSVSFDIEVVADIPVSKKSGKYKIMLPYKENNEDSVAPLE